MVLEQFLERRVITRHFSFLFFISTLYVIIAYAAQTIFFPDQGLATALLVTVLLVPSLHHLIVIEERIERTGSSHFLKRHRTIIRCYLGAFFGLLAGFLVLGSVDSHALAYQLQNLQAQHLRPELISSFSAYEPSGTIALALFSHNLQYLLLGFVLSLFYGAGAIFILAYNASFFAAFVIELMRRFPAGGELAFVSLLHLVPEAFGFLLTAIAGATLSRALIHEKLVGQPFKNVLRNCFLLLLSGVLSIFLAAFIETYVTAVIFKGLV